MNLAAVDLGSNSFHLIAARYTDGRLQVVDRIKESVRLRAGLNANRRLTKKAQERALNCLGRFAQRLSAMETEKVRVVGTETLRQARNSAAFTRAARRVTGLDIEVISGFEEARLIYMGVAHSLGFDDRPRLVADIGGGSTELILGQGMTPRELESLSIGCISASEEFFPEGKVTERAMRAALLAGKRLLKPAAKTLGSSQWKAAVGSSGSILSIQSILEKSGWSDHGISAQGLEQLRQSLIAARHYSNFDLPSLSPDRAPVLAGGVAILQAIFETLGVESISISEGALREGLLHDLIGRQEDRDIREQTVESLLSQYGIDRKQAANVREVALRLFSHLRAGWGLKNKHRDLLRWAAMLHEIGLSVAHGGHHKHGSYLMQHMDMPGFSIDDQVRLAILIRGQRRALPKRLFLSLPAEDAVAYQRLLVLLRLAIIFQRDRAEKPETAAHATATATAKRLRLTLPEGWLARRPLTQMDLEQEASMLRKLGIHLEL